MTRQPEDPETLFKRYYAMFPYADEPLRTRWAEGMTHKIRLQYAYAGSEYPFPFEPADYTEDPK